MSTVTLWLLISVGYYKTPSVLIERFSDAESCDHVAKTIISTAPSSYGTPIVRCIQAKVYKP